MKGTRGQEGFSQDKKLVQLVRSEASLGGEPDEVQECMKKSKNYVGGLRLKDRK